MTTQSRELLIDDSSDQPQIHRAILAATRDMPAIAKTGTMELGGKAIPFTKIDDIRAALYPILENHGINTYMDVVDKKLELQVADPALTGAQKFPEGHELAGTLIPQARPIGDGRIATTRSRAEVTIAMTFVYAGDGSQVTVSAPGESYDTNGDKATNKATTSAVKRIFVETFKVVDRAEADIEGVDPDAGNRATTTDRREEAGDRGTQQRQAAGGLGSGTTGTRRSGPVRSITTDPRLSAQREVQQAVDETGADLTSGELPAPAAPPEPSELDRQKARVRAASQILGIPPAELNAIATQLTGKEKREDWINLVTAVKKIADELESRVAAREEQN